MNDLRKEDVVILIPSLHPDGQLLIYVEDLIRHGFKRIVVIDDGSGPTYSHFFTDLEQFPECSVLGYPVNKGKGFALKHGMHYILQAFPDAPGVVTADSDGQHTAPDCLKTAQAMLEHPEKLVLGTRDFMQENVPAKNRTGNRLTSFFFLLLYGHWLPDTQTGLRGMSRELMLRMMDIPGERFEFEMNMLIHAAGWHIGFKLVPISTIYLQANAGTHFRPLQDSVRIYRLLFSNIFRFAYSSILSTMLDIGLFTMLDIWLIPRLFPVFAAGRNYSPVLAATAVARVCSALFNYKVNRQFVFQVKRSKGSLFRYAILAISAMLASATLVHILSINLGMHRTLAKMIVDGSLFFINYRISKSWVFTSSEERKN